VSADRVAVVAHELRSPVAALAAIAEAAAERRGAMGEDELRHLLALATSAARDIERLVSDSDPLSIDPRRLDVEQLVRSVARAGVSVDVEPGLVVVADPVRVRQALGNLVDNACRHGSAVAVSARSREGTIRVAVADDGPGVDPTLDVFAAGVSGAGSTGYGLAIARALARAHGGEVELESVAGGGATFTLVLPSSAEEPSGRAR
jgi:signal transduction histidine kinase